MKCYTWIYCTVFHKQRIITQNFIPVKIKRPPPLFSTSSLVIGTNIVHEQYFITTLSWAIGCSVVRRHSLKKSHSSSSDVFGANLLTNLASPLEHRGTQHTRPSHCSWCARFPQTGPSASLAAPGMGTRRRRFAAGRTAKRPSSLKHQPKHKRGVRGFANATALVALSNA